MERIEIMVGPYGWPEAEGGSRELIAFQGEKLAEIFKSDSHTEGPGGELIEGLKYELYACPGGYRVLIHLAFNFTFLNPRRCGHVGFAVAPGDNSRTLLSEEEARERNSSLVAAAGLVRDLDGEVQATSSEGRERVIRFANIMRLVHSR